MRRLGARIVALAAIVVVLSAVLLRIDDHTDVDVAGAKLDFFEANSGAYDTVFIGSSYLYREVAPTVFDRVTAMDGVPTRSFNLGVPGMDPPETYFVIDRILAMRPARLKYFVIELDYFRETVRPRNVHTRRFDYWHDTVRTEEAVRGAAEFKLGWRKGVKDSGFHAEGFLRRFFNVGRGRVYIERLWSAQPSAESELAALGVDRDGFLALDDDPSQRTGVRREFYEAFEEDRYDEKLEQLKRANVADDESESGIGKIDVVALRRTLELIERAGARPILLIPPCLATRADLIRMREQGLHADVLAFNDPAAFPELYAPQYRFDVGHLNKAGAEIFSTLLAREFAKIVRPPVQE